MCKSKKERIAIILDNTPSHLHYDTTHLEFIKVLFLPKNTTAILQLLDQNQKKSLKIFKKKHFLKVIIQKFEAKQKINVSILESINLVSEAWDNVKESTTQNCFEHPFHLRNNSNFVKETIFSANDLETNEQDLDLKMQWDFICKVPDEKLFQPPDLDSFIEKYFDENKNDDCYLEDTKILQLTKHEMVKSFQVINRFLLTSAETSEKQFNNLYSLKAFSEEIFKKIRSKKRSMNF